MAHPQSLGYRTLEVLRKTGNAKKFNSADYAMPQRKNDRSDTERLCVNVKTVYRALQTLRGL